MKSVILKTTLLWLIVTGCCGYFYALTRVTSPTAIPGYETTWKFQLVMFSIFRLPLFVLSLGIILWVERLWLGRRRR
jgi:hypothetical protein